MITTILIIAAVALHSWLLGILAVISFIGDLMIQHDREKGR